MKPRVLLVALVVSVAGLAVWLRRARPESRPASVQPEALLPDRQAFAAWQQGLKLDTRTDYRPTTKEAAPPPRR